MRRREFSTLLGSAASTVWPSLVRAQQKSMPMIGWLNSGSPGLGGAFLSAFRQGLADAGYIEGQTVAIDYLWAEDQNDRLPVLASELVGRKVDVIVTGASGASARAAKAATATIPIVFGTGDPVAIGLVDNLARPTGNLTGVAYLVGDLSLKRLDLVAEAVPQARIVGMLANPNNAYTPSIVPQMQEAARARGVQLLVVRAGSESEIEAAFPQFVRSGVGALVIQADPYIHSRRDRLLALAAQHRLPAIYTWPEFPAAGGLMSYGPSLSAVYRQIGTYAGRILKGARPAELPVVQPTTFELVINLKTSEALGLTMPPAILVRADKVIE
jgi:putative tryptophan/tyrosine transport system substrate-binding protein